jgi:beta-glucosidase
VRVTVAGAGTVAIGDGGTVTVPPTGGPYNYVTLDADFTARGVRDLRVLLGGDVRLARLTFIQRGTTA